MSVLVYAETHQGKFKKSAFEALSYAQNLNEEIAALCVNAIQPEELFAYGAQKVINLQSEQTIDAQVIAKQIDCEQFNFIVMSHATQGLNLAPQLVAKSGAALITNVVSQPSQLSPFRVARKAFSGKAIMEMESDAKCNILCLAVNAFELKQNPVAGEVENRAISAENSQISVEKIEALSNAKDLKTAEIVVSGGRGLKNAENFKLLEDLAEVLGAATACSKPVSDMDWRPHSEHVGQTGKNIAPNLYIAAGISGAIQHLAGVNASKRILVINTDAEAPFFKAADYGILGDAMEVLPKLTEALRKLKS
ncbi:electron transfer flavoprotein subunit alpha/FixB family protein [Ornithobacterium rhinotracheale]|uniref:electron transfer flavoprotein subunit alpha/FixB family protein n=1 Tax=Ornithobacterium rhinotracheale TaxID=28251 RepID=UPI00129C5E62|nr:electron transfer flavoprotein subunit alpha/FixB family protein [Ornithobacterium rhinotracheale]MRJ10158.1 electron transfer flavoprotein subunit alpha/FixB family protein [Ornithobacterium rhinotracheale]